MTNPPAPADDLDDEDDPYGDAEHDESLTTALREALAHTPRLPRDRAVVRLALHYAAMLDDAFDRLAELGRELDPDESVANLNRLTSIVAKIGPRYEATLDKLGMSPGARPSARGGDPAGVSPQAAWLAALQGGTTPAGSDPGASVDPAVTAADTGD